MIAAIVLRASPQAIAASATQVSRASLSARALAYISSNATGPISLEDVAAAVHRSAPHTATTVKQDTGRTVMEWIMEIRMASARQLLLKTNERVEEVDARVGFGSPSHVHRAFKRIHGASPGRWRAAHR